MGLNKNKKVGNVKNFSFAQLVPENGKCENPDEVMDFSFQSLDHAENLKNEITQEGLREEREFEKQSPFNILSMVRNHRGIEEQEKYDYENDVATQVQAKLEQLKMDGFEEGKRLGREEGYEFAYKEAKEKFDLQAGEVQKIVDDVLEQSKDTLLKNQKNAYRMIKNLTKWVLLREIDAEEYLPTLLEKLIHEINIKNNLVVRVNTKSFKDMPSVVEKVEAKIGELKNARIEVDLDMEYPGLILETENGIIDGSFKAQMESINKLFETVGVDANESN